jgi:transposase
MILNKQIFDQCVSIYETERISIEAVAKKLSIKFNDIFLSARYYKYQLRKSGEINRVTDKITESEIVHEYSNGMSINKLSKLFNISNDTVNRVLRENNIDMKPLGFFNKTAIFNEVELISLYRKGLNNQKIAKLLNISANTVRLFLKKNGLNSNFPKINSHNRKHKNALEDRIIELYSENKSYSQIAKILNTNHCLVSRIIRKNNFIYKSRGNRRYALDENYFDQIDSPDKAFILGTILTDGCNSINCGRRVICIELKSDDKPLLEYINTCFGSNRPLYYRKSKDTFRLNINSRIISDDLLKFGCTCPKSLTLEYPYLLDDKYFEYFLSGCIFGDGWVYNENNFSVGLSGTKDLLEKIMNKITMKTGLKNSITPESNCKTLFRITFGGDSAVKICNFIFKNAPFIMKRKYLPFKEYVMSKYNNIEELSFNKHRDTILEAIDIIRSIESNPKFANLLEMSNINS